MSSRKLAKLMTEAGLLPEDAANELLQQEKDSALLTLDSLICQAGHAEPAQIDHFLSEAFRLAKIDLPEVLSPQKEALELLDADTVTKYQAFPYAVDEANLWLVASLPLRMSRIQALGESTERTLKISALNQIYFALLVEQHYGIAPPEDLLPLIDEWPLPTPEEAADMVYTPPPKEAKKKSKPTETPTEDVEEPTTETAEESSVVEESSVAKESSVATPTTAEAPPATAEPTETTSETAPEEAKTPESTASTNVGISLADADTPGIEMTEDLAGSAQAAVQFNEPTEMLGSTTTVETQPTTASKAQDTAPIEEVSPEATSIEQATEVEQTPEPSTNATETAQATPSIEESPTNEAPVDVLPLGIYETEYLLRNAQTRDGVLELGLHFFSTKLQNAGLFLIRKQAVKGLRMVGTPAQDKSFQSLEISLDTSTFFSAMLDALVPYSGAPSEEEVDRPLFSLFSPPPKHVYLLPVRVRGRTVALLYGHLFEGILSNEDFEQLVRCTYQMSQSLEHVILAVKKGMTEESASMDKALRAMRKGDKASLDSILEEGRETIQSIENEAVAAIERVQQEETRIAQERADKLARAAELARAAREQAAQQAAQAPVSQTTDFLDATADDVSTLPVTQTGDFANVTAPVTQTGDFANVTDPVTQTGDFANVTAPVTQTGDFANVTAPVTQTGDFANATTAPIKETAAYLDAFPVDAETLQKLTSKTAPKESEASNEASETSTTSEPTETAKEDVVLEAQAAEQTSVVEESLASIVPAQEISSSLDSVLSSAGIGDAFPDLMSAFDDDALSPNKTNDEKSSDVIGAEISSTGDGEGAEIASNAANPLAEVPQKSMTTTSLLATIIPTDDLLRALGGELDTLGTPTASQQDLPALGTPTESSTHLPEMTTSAEAAASSEQAETQAAQDSALDLSFLLQEMPHIPEPFPPASEEVTVLLPMLQDESERMREVALQSFRDLPLDKSVSALMYELLKELRAEDVQDDGTLSEEKQGSPIETLYQLFLEHKEEAASALSVQLYHNTPDQNTLILRLLPRLPLGNKVWPHLIHFVLRLDEHLAKPSLLLLEKHKDNEELQDIAAYLRDNLTAEAPEYGARVLRLLQKLQTTDLIKATRRFLHAKDPAVAEMAARLTLLSLREEISQEQEISAPSTPPPLSIENIFLSDLEDPPSLPPKDDAVEEMLAFFDLPGETLHKETLLVLREMPAKRLTHTLLHHFPGTLSENDFTEEGELHPNKLKTREGYIWQLLCQTPAETVGHFVPLLAHKQPRTRLVTLQLLRHVSPSPILPYLFRYLLDFNAQIVETCRKLLLQNRSDMQFQKIVEWMREQLEFSDPTQAIRAVRVLAVLRDTVAVPNLVELVQHEDRELAEAATLALQTITKQSLPAQYKKWSKWWSKVGSRSERVDWLIEAIQLKDEAIVQAANQELIELTEQDFGLSSEAGRRERNNAIQQWKTWRKQHPIF